MKLLRKGSTFLFIVALVHMSCNSEKKRSLETEKNVLDDKKKTERLSSEKVPEGMVWIPGGKFLQGAVPMDKMAMAHEKPQHEVQVSGFFMDIHPVTNKQFSKFIDETGYITVAERGIDWEEMKKQVPTGTPKPHDSILQPGSLVFKKTESSVPNLYDYSQWWKWKIGANWKHPNGPESSIEDKDNHPVVQIAYEDAFAYCEWADRRLPTEAEWEYAARAGNENLIYFWGNDASKLSKYANTWEGEFPVENTLDDGFERQAPVMSYPANDFGLYDMSGNVWEWTSDWYDPEYYKEMELLGIVKNPTGPMKPINLYDPNASKKMIRGASFLCSASYCASYRISARMAISMDSGVEHLGFRTVKSP